MKKAEIDQLKKTVQALRDVLEQERITHSEERQKIRQSDREENQLLEKMIVALRDELERARV